MKIINYGMVFVCLIFVAVITLDTNQMDLDKETSLQQQYNRAVDTAMDAAVRNLVEVADGSDLQLDVKDCIDNFYAELYVAFGVSDSNAGKKKLMMYLPCLAIADNDGLYVIYNDLSEGVLVQKWSNKIPYVYSGIIPSAIPNEEKTYDVLFGLDDTVRLVYNGNVYQGAYNALDEIYQDDSAFMKVYKKTILAKAGTYNNVKNSTITGTITKNLQLYLDKYNTVANENGVGYHFELPDGTSTTIARSISGITFMAVFQGYPYGVGTDSVYSNFAISGTRISKSTGVYACYDKDGNYLYHSRFCPEIDGEISEYSSGKEAALHAAYPCPKCRP